MQYIIGVDIGTTHTKAVAITADGKVLEEAKATYVTRNPMPGYSEQDPEDLFQAVLNVLRKVLASLNGTNNVSVICFSAAMHSVLAVDREGNPITPLYTWADTRSNKYAMLLRNNEAGHRIYRQTGTPIHPMSPLCKIAWIRDELPAVFAATHKFISGKEYVLFRLLGLFLVDHSLASATGLFNFRELRWNKDALNYCGITESHLSQPVSATHFETGLKEQYARELSLDNSVRFMVGASDGGLANIGSGAVLPGEAALTIGTSGAVRILSTHPLEDKKERLFNYVVTPPFYVCGGGMNNGGIVLKWFAENVLDKSFSSDDGFTWFIDTAFTSPVGSKSLIFLPYIYGERSPVWDANATGIFHGVSSIHTKQDFMRAILEGISFSLYQIMLAVEETVTPIHTIFASGGFISSREWLQMLADILNKKVIVSHAGDASAMGAGFLALHATGMMKDWRDVKRMVVNSTEYLPNAVLHHQYQENYKIFSRLYHKAESA